MGENSHFRSLANLDSVTNFFSEPNKLCISGALENGSNLLKDERVLKFLITSLGRLS